MERKRLREIKRKRYIERYGERTIKIVKDRMREREREERIHNLMS